MSPAEPDSGAAAGVHELLAQLQDDRQWLLRQLDAGAWPDYRLDLAALERELGALLDRAQDKLSS
ncbi:MAG: hypothetical protein FJ078_01815 [Cyanobacteria bacterium K_DeepCast_35m_m2_155]|nr:hypothetical protein [Cyanobacteria bacterium K_DeepCast_35m_m2_155]